MSRILVALVLFSLFASLSGLVDMAGAEDMPLPSIGDKFVYHVKVTGNREATRKKRTNTTKPTLSWEQMRLRARQRRA